MPAWVKFILYFVVLFCIATFGGAITRSDKTMAPVVGFFAFGWVLFGFLLMTRFVYRFIRK
jgi:hypothetical protein